MPTRLRRLLARLARTWRVDEPPKVCIEDSGKVHLDPDNDGRYTAEGRLRALAEAQEASFGGAKEPRGAFQASICVESQS
jgi:hypothetical protein